MSHVRSQELGKELGNESGKDAGKKSGKESGKCSLRERRDQTMVNCSGKCYI